MDGGVMEDEAAAVAQQYFDRVRARDLGVADLFHEDASIVGLGGEKSGREAIRSFYEASIKGAGPSPQIIGSIFASGPRAAAEIEISLSDGSTIHAMDLFVVEEGLIRSLTYFIADH
jgi:hypothetical protein